MLRQLTTATTGPVLVAGLFLLFLQLASAEDIGRRNLHDLDWHTIDGGGDMWTSGGESGLQLSGTIGQSDANPFVMTGGTLELVGGFWAVGVPGPPIPGDCDGDGDVDFTDFVSFGDCMAGPESGLGLGCACVDLDGDNDVDLADFAAFQRAFTAQSQ